MRVIPIIKIERASALARPFILLVSILVLFPSLPARADRLAQISPDQQAKACWEKGLKLFESKKYRAAWAQFSKGYELSKKPAFLFNVAECARLCNEKKQAYELYRRYLTENYHGKLRAEAEQRCKELALGPCLPELIPTPAPAGDVAPTSKGPSALPAAQTRQSSVEPKPYLPQSNATPQDTSKPFYKRWPLWVGIGAVVVAGSVTAAVLATRGKDRGTPPGDLVVQY